MSLLIREPKNALSEVRRGKFSWNFHNLPIEFKRYLLAVAVFMLGTAYDWFNLASGMMLLPASIIFGWLYENAGATIAFEFSACCAVLSTVLLFRVKLRAD